MRKRMEKWLIALTALFCLNFAFVQGASAQSAGGTELQLSDLTAEKLEALGNSIYFDVDNSLKIDEKKARQAYKKFTGKELKSIAGQLAAIPEERVLELKQIALAEQAAGEGEVQVMAIPLIVWAGIGVAGILAGGAAIYFTGKYMSWQEKKYLVDTCYAAGGRPILDSGDTAGINSAPQKAWWKFGNTYSFECAK